MPDRGSQIWIKCVCVSKREGQRERGERGRRRKLANKLNVFVAQWVRRNWLVNISVQADNTYIIYKLKFSSRKSTYQCAFQVEII